MLITIIFAGYCHYNRLLFDHYWITGNFLLLYLFLSYFFIIPTVALCFLRIKRGGNLKILNKSIRIFSYVLIFILIPSILFQFREAFFVLDTTPYDFYLSLSYIFSWDYVTNTEFGLVYDLINFAPTMVYGLMFIIAVFIYKTNKLSLAEVE